MSDAIKEAVKGFIASYAPDLVGEITPLTLEEIGVKHLLHISMNNDIAKFVPTVPPRSTEDSDHRIPRVCTAVSLAGCFLGYVNDVFDYMERSWGEVDERVPKPFLGGYVIYGFTPDVAVRPSKVLLSDQECSGEHWLLPYVGSPEYVPVKLGKIFHTVLTHVRQPDKENKVRRDTTTLLEVFPGNSIPWDNRTILTEGYWRIYTQALLWSKAWNEVNPYSVEAIDKETYLAAKKLTADLLSLQDAPPASNGW